MTSWVYDVKQPDTAPWIIDEFTLGRSATALTATATATATGGLRIDGLAQSPAPADPPASGTVTVSLGSQELARLSITDGAFSGTLPAGLLDAGTHTLRLVLPRSRTHLAASMSLGVTVAAPSAPSAPSPLTPSSVASVVVASVVRLRRGQVRLATTEGFSLDFLPEVIAAFRQGYAGIHFSLEVCAPAVVTRRVQEGDADLGLTFSLRPEPDIRVEATLSGARRLPCGGG